MRLICYISDTPDYSVFVLFKLRVQIIAMVTKLIRT
jgi:hypothetical protein